MAETSPIYPPMITETSAQYGSPPLQSNYVINYSAGDDIYSSVTRWLTFRQHHSIIKTKMFLSVSSNSTLSSLLLTQLQTS